MNRRSMIGMIALGLVGCATAKVKPASAPVLKCIVCGVTLDHYNWYGEEGPFCDRHLQERMAKDRPKKGLISQNLVFHYGKWPRA